MKTLTISVDNDENIVFIKTLLSKFQFVRIIETSKKNTGNLKERYKKIPIHWATQKPIIEDFTKIISSRNITLNEIREKAWLRK